PAPHRLTGRWTSGGGMDVATSEPPPPASFPATLRSTGAFPSRSPLIAGLIGDGLLLAETSAAKLCLGNLDDSPSRSVRLRWSRRWPPYCPLGAFGLTANSVRGAACQSNHAEPWQATFGRGPPRQPK